MIGVLLFEDIVGEIDLESEDNDWSDSDLDDDDRRSILLLRLFFEKSVGAFLME